MFFKYILLQNYIKNKHAFNNVKFYLFLFLFQEKMQSVLISHEEVMRLRQVLEDDDARVDSRMLNTLRADHIQLKVFFTCIFSF